MLTPEEFLKNIMVDNQPLVKTYPAGSDWDLLRLLTKFLEFNMKYHSFCPSRNLLREFWQRSSDACPLEVSEAEEQELAFEQWIKDKVERQPDFEQATRPLIKWLNENHHPHMTIIVHSNGAELLEGQKTTGEITDYIRD